MVRNSEIGDAGDDARADIVKDIRRATQHYRAVPAGGHCREPVLRSNLPALTTTSEGLGGAYCLTCRNG